MKQLFSKFPVGKKFQVLFIAITAAVLIAASIYFVLLFNAQSVLTSFFDGSFKSVKAESTVSDLLNANYTLTVNMTTDAVIAGVY